MINKEKEIEEIKARLKFHIAYAGISNNCCIVNQNDIKKLLQYIEQLESDNKEIIEKVEKKIKEYQNERNKLADGHFHDSPDNINRDMSLFIASETLRLLLE